MRRIELRGAVNLVDTVERWAAESYEMAVNLVDTVLVRNALLHNEIADSVNLST